MYRLSTINKNPDILTNWPHNFIHLKCDFCDKKFKRYKYGIRAGMARGQLHAFCCRECMGLYGKKTCIVPCFWCHEPVGRSAVTQPPFKLRSISKYKTNGGKLFCSTKCSHKFMLFSHVSKEFSAILNIEG